MHNASDQAGAKSRVPISTIIVGVLVIVAAIVVVWELRVRSQWNATYQAIASRIGDEQNLPTKQEVEKLLQGNPRREPGDHQELFIWSGILQKYRMRLYYSGNTVTKIESQ